MAKVFVLLVALLFASNTYSIEYNSINMNKYKIKVDKESKSDTIILNGREVDQEEYLSLIDAESRKSEQERIQKAEIQCKPNWVTIGLSFLFGVGVGVIL